MHLLHLLPVLRTPCVTPLFPFLFSSEDLESENRRFSLETDFIAPETAFTWRLGAELNYSHAQELCETAEGTKYWGPLVSKRAVFFWELKTL